MAPRGAVFSPGSRGDGTRGRGRWLWTPPTLRRDFGRFGGKSRKSAILGILGQRGRGQPVINWKNDDFALLEPIDRNGVLTACPSLVVCSDRGCRQRPKEAPRLLSATVLASFPIATCSLWFWIHGRELDKHDGARCLLEDVSLEFEIAILSYEADMSPSEGDAS
ncbi:hypothetical protein CRG98_027422 [Punica granatum]|uniref:Uncharacterized protein n=1 Tax=Punica granatum TaxID=22663 RepID=A0A2I0J7G2_PUNGR|nr:hypothetical protein CRG98_027422 [Punica granatum]